MNPVQREIDCPRCHEQCGWCSDYRHMHGTLKLPGSKRKCAVPNFAPEGDGCPLCGGAKRVIATTTYSRQALTSIKQTAASGGDLVPARDGIEAQQGLNDVFSGDMVKPIATSRDVMLAGGVDPDAPFAVGAFPAEMRQQDPALSPQTAASGDGGEGET